MPGTTPRPGVARLNILQPQSGNYIVLNNAEIELRLEATGGRDLVWFVNGAALPERGPRISQKFVRGDYEIRCVAGTTGEYATARICVR
jgi:hypothetical protein